MGFRFKNEYVQYSADYREKQRRTHLIHQYLLEKLPEGHIDWFITEVSKLTPQGDSFGFRVLATERYWKEVLRPGLQYFADDWNLELRSAITTIKLKKSMYGYDVLFAGKEETS